MMSKVTIPALFLVFVTYTDVAAQSVFGLLKNREKQADQYYNEGAVEEATRLYTELVAEGKGTPQVLLKLARSFYQSRDYAGAIKYYTLASSTSGAGLSAPDLLALADAQIVAQDLDAARASLKQYLQHHPDNELVSKKLWRLNNMGFLYEDSAHFSVRPMPVNTPAHELGAQIIDGKLVFASNRKEIRPIDRTSTSEATGFFKLYGIGMQKDSATNRVLVAGDAIRFAPNLGGPYNTGPAAFYDDGIKMVFVATSAKPDASGRYHLGLYFAMRDGEAWKMTGAYEHNSEEYSISDVAIDDSGTRLFFSSTIRDGVGGKDLYKSEFVDRRWSRPQNLGDVINTTGDECFPYVYRSGTLYFASNGHSGIGGLDIFSSAILGDNLYSEPENLGYPINTNHDDFGFTLDSTAAHGYITSNRNGTNDDIYEFDMEIRAYPFDITGVLYSKDHELTDDRDMAIWPEAKMELVDTWHDRRIATTESGADGSFSFSIPYFSRYHILITTPDGHEYKASLELEKFRTSTIYEVVVVKDIFTGNDSR